jgi:hypothetical protein
MSDIREALASAFDTAAEETDTTETTSAPAEVEAVEAAPEPVEVAEPIETTEAATKADRVRDEKGKFTKAQADATSIKAALKAAAKPAAPVDPKAAVKPDAATAPTTEPKPEAAKVEAVKAPQSWKPAAREHFAKLPAEVQAEVIRRERETATAMQEAAPARKFHQEFQSVVAPYMGMIQAEGAEPMKAVANLLQTAAALRTAPPAHKAQLVANMVRTFGIDISALDAALAGQPSQHAAPTQSQGVDPASIAARVQQQVMQQLQAQRQAALQQKSATDVEAFGQAREFFEDLREDMADLLQSAHRRGVALTLEDAYNRAARMHPEISQVLSQREAAKAANATQASTQRARAAASSVRSQPASAPKGAQPQDLRSQLLANWDASTGR